MSAEAQHQKPWWSQTEIAGDPFAAAESLRFSQNQQEGQAVSAPTPRWVIKRYASGDCFASCSMACVRSAIVGLMRSETSADLARDGSPRELRQ